MKDKSTLGLHDKSPVLIYLHNHAHPKKTRDFTKNLIDSALREC